MSTENIETERGRFRETAGSTSDEHAAWQAQHQTMLQNEMHISDRFLVEVASRLGVSCKDFRSDEVRAQYAELRDRIFECLSNNAIVETHEN